MKKAGIVAVGFISILILVVFVSGCTTHTVTETNDSNVSKVANNTHNGTITTTTTTDLGKNSTTDKTYGDVLNMAILISSDVK